MQTVFVAVNASYMHTNLAVRSIASYCGKNSFNIDIAEYNINQHFEYVLEELYSRKADVYLFSCYIWNIEYICQLAQELSKLCPNAKMFAGGPQVSYEADKFLKENLHFNGVLYGEGEQTCLNLLELLQSNNSLEKCNGLITRNFHNKPPLPLNMDELVFPYSSEDLLANKILYCESMRGCPYNCSYCLSSVEKGVRFKTLNLVFKDLDKIIKAKPKQLKFVDRSFNCNPRHAMAIWQYLKENDNGKTNFHFELAAHTLTNDMIEFLATVRPGLFQFEIGVQSCNEKTLTSIHRNGELEILFKNIYLLNKGKNIHLHLDLIAGLPFENFESFANSFNKVYSASPQQFQLGFLKLLQGSFLEQQAENYGIVCQSKPPFEVLFTNSINYEELSELKKIASIVEIYYNSGRFEYTIKELCSNFNSPFEFYQKFASFYNEAGYFERSASKQSYYDILGEFALKYNVMTEKLQWLCRWDMAAHEKIKFTPNWVDVEGSRKYRQQILNFYANTENINKYLPEYYGRHNKQIIKMAHIEVFPFNPSDNSANIKLGVEYYPVLFNYMQRDITGRANNYFVNLEGL